MRGGEGGDYSREVIILNISIKGEDYSREAITRGTAIYSRKYNTLNLLNTMLPFVPYAN